MITKAQRARLQTLARGAGKQVTFTTQMIRVGNDYGGDELENSERGYQAAETMLIQLQGAGNQEPEEPGDWIETYSTEVQEAGIAVSDTMHRIAEALNAKEPVTPQEVADARQEMEELEVGLDVLRGEFNKLFP